MRFLSSRGALAWAFIGVLVYACTGPDRDFIDTGGNAGEGGEGLTGSGGAAGSSSGKGGKGGTAGSGGSAAMGGTSGVGGSAGDSGAGGDPGGGEGGGGGEPEPPPPPGRPGTALVAGGRWMSSPNYQLFSITGNGSLQVNSTSTRYRLHGGIVGTTQP